MVRYLMFFQYIGTGYRGLAFQPPQSYKDSFHSKPVMNVLLEALKEATKQEDLSVMVSSRTDKGVHALCNSAHFDLEPRPGRAPMDPWELLFAANKLLTKEDIKILQILRVHDKFQARFDVMWRTYLYRIVTGYSRYQVPITERRRCWPLRDRLDVQKMQEASRHLVGYKDFGAFRSVTQTIKDKYTWRFLKRVEVTEEKSDLHKHGFYPPSLQTINIEVEGRSFLYHQMRRIAGTLVAVGQGKLMPDNVHQKLISKNPDINYWQVEQAPPGGLYLKRVVYRKEDLEFEEDIWEKTHEGAFKDEDKKAGQGSDRGHRSDGEDSGSETDYSADTDANDKLDRSITSRMMQTDSSSDGVR